MPEARGKGATAVLLFGAIVSGLAIAEIALRIWFAGPSLVIDPAHARLVRPDPSYMPGVSGPARLEASSVGLRSGALTDAHTLRVIALGGSTTESLVLDTDEAWPAILQAALTAELSEPVWVGNGGISGISTRHHVIQIGALLEQIDGIDVALLLVGVNDLFRGLRQMDAPTDWYEDPAERVRVHYEAFGAAARPGFGLLWERTELVHALRRARQGWRRVGEASSEREADFIGQYADARAERASSLKVDEIPDLTNALASYRRNLERVIAQAESHGTRVVLITQPALWKADPSAGLDPLMYLGEKDPARPPLGRTFYSAQALARGMDIFNAATLDICADHGLDCFDLAPMLPPDTTIFYDDVHFNESGARAVAAAMTPFLADLLRRSGS